MAGRVSRPAVILIVDDEEIVRRIVARKLLRLGYTVLVAEHGKEGLDVARGHGCPIDLVITDVVMPGMNGPHMVDLLKGTCPELRVLYMSGHPQPFIVSRGLLPPAAHFLEKGAIPQELVKKVRDLLATMALS